MSESNQNQSQSTAAVDIDNMTPSILVIAKNPSKMSPVKYYLERRKWKVDTTAAANEALQILETEKFDFVLLSVNSKTPRLEQVATLLAQSFNIPVVMFAEESDAKTSARLNSLKAQYKITGQASGPSIQRNIRAFLARIHGMEDVATESGGKKTQRTSSSNSGDQNINIKGGGSGDKGAIKIRGDNKSEGGMVRIKGEGLSKEYEATQEGGVDTSSLAKLKDALKKNAGEHTEDEASGELQGHDESGAVMEGGKSLTDDLETSSAENESNDYEATIDGEESEESEDEGAGAGSKNRDKKSSRQSLKDKAKAGAEKAAKEAEERKAKKREAAEHEAAERAEREAEVMRRKEARAAEAEKNGEFQAGSKSRFGTSSQSGGASDESLSAMAEGSKEGSSGVAEANGTASQPASAKEKNKFWNRSEKRSPFLELFKAAVEDVLKFKPASAEIKPPSSSIPTSLCIQTVQGDLQGFIVYQAMGDHCEERATRAADIVGTGAELHHLALGEINFAPPLSEELSVLAAEAAEVFYCDGSTQNQVSIAFFAQAIEKLNSAETPVQGKVQIPIHVLDPGVSLTFKVYIWLQMNQKMIMYLNEGGRIEPSQKERLQTAGTIVYVELAQVSLAEKYFHKTKILSWLQSTLLANAGNSDKAKPAA